MKREVLGKCPICDEELRVTKLNCPNCNTNIEGEFSLCRFCQLSEEQKHFLEAFIRNRGNIKEIEKDLDISYPTVRNKLEDVIETLGYRPRNEEPRMDRQDVLDRLEGGEISSEEAIKLLRGEE